jgi:Tol biopolymer transport system component
MKAAAALAIAVMLTVEQRDATRSMLGAASVAVSGNGRYVAFTTYSALVAADTDWTSDVYVLDRQTRRVTMESTATTVDVGDATHPGISADGRYVVFERARRVIVRDRSEGIARVVGEGGQPVIAENGGVVIFAGGHNPRVEDADVNGERSDIYVTDLQSGRVRRVSTVVTGLDPATTAHVQPSTSSDGRVVAFTSTPQINRARPAVRVFVRDLERNVTRLVAEGWDPSISGDGRVIAYTSLHNRTPHIFLMDVETGTTRRITNSVRRGAANGASGKAKMSSDGRFVAFQSEASDLVAAEDINLLWDVFVFDRETSVTTRISGDGDAGWMEPSVGPSIDARGSVVAFSSRHPTDASDKRNDFDLYVAAIGARERP